VHLTRLALTDFRNYESADVALGPGVTTFTGANGAGKTNLIEAAYYVAVFGSHRVNSDAALVRAGAPRAILRASVRSQARASLVESELNLCKANRVRLNRVPLTRPRDALGTLRCVLFAPEDLAIVKGDPSERRGYLDDLLVASRPRYAAVRSEYERVVKQRTALLKSARAAGRTPAGLEVWDEQLIDKGAELTEGRLKLAAALRPKVTASYADVAADERDASISYRLRAIGELRPRAGSRQAQAAPRRVS
jgi:DNA replication and repair protein RecF